LFETTSSKFSPTPPREATPPRDPVKGKEIAIMKEQVNELVTYQEEERGSIPKMPKLKSFITPEGTLKRTQFLKESFITEDIRVNGMNKNVIPPPEVVPIEGLVIKEPDLGIFYMNMNTDKVFQRETSESNIRRIRVKDIVKEVKDYLKTYSSAEMDISWRETQYHLKARQKEPVVLVTCRTRLNLIITIRERISNTPREALFRETCFGWILDLDDWPENCIIIHFRLGRQVECLGGEANIVPLSYHIVYNFEIQFCREEFCLVTGLRFGVEYNADYNNEDDSIPLRRRVFSSAIDGKPITGKMLESKIKSEKFYRLNDHDAVSLCCVVILQFVLLGLKDRRKVPDWILRLANDRGDWDMYPWGSYVWPILYSQLKNANVKRWQPLYATEQKEDGIFHGHISEAARIPRNVNRQNEDDVPSEFYREFEEPKRVLKEMMKRESIHEQMYNQMRKCMEGFPHVGPSSFPTQPSTSYFEGAQATPFYVHNMATPNLKTPMPSHPGTSSWQSQMSSHSATPNWQTLIPSHPRDAGLFNSNKGKNGNVSPSNGKLEESYVLIFMEREAEATLANQLLCNLTGYFEQMRSREIQMTILQNMPTMSLNSYGLHALLMTNEANIRTTNNLITTRQELLRIIAAKQNFINSYMLHGNIDSRMMLLKTT
nr:phospholipase-like protein [Tanacetum cinerariifolium]